MYVEREDVSNKNAAVAAALCLLFGSLGLHRFYVGKYTSGIIFLVFGSSHLGVRIFSKLLGFNGIIISVVLLLFITIAVFYDLHALYSECFLDSKGKILISGSRQDELIGRTPEEKFDAKLTILITVLLFIVYIILYALFLI
jgi:TM2 domain-containing membrane protein YozV